MCFGHRSAARSTGRYAPVVEIVTRDAPGVPAAIGGYANAVEVAGARMLLFISGQIPMSADGRVPAGFEAQCRQVWANILECLREAGLGVEHLVKITTYLSDRSHADVNGAVRREVLGDHRPALTVVLAGIFDEGWLLEIEPVAAA
jgi:2-iminobutanoate/2-iminopropanoate deaminase